MTNDLFPKGEADERGLLSTELAFFMPFLVFVAIFAVFVASIGRHSARTQQAADAAARAASLERTEPDARAAALAAANRVCAGTATIDPSFSFDPPDIDTFTPGRTSLIVRCTEDFQSFGFGSTRTEAAGAVAVIEYWRTTPP